MTSRLTLIDDDVNAREVLRTSINALGSGDFDVVAFAPPADFDLTKVLSVDTDLFLIDYELDTPQPDGLIPNYRGGVLAARIREEKSEYPIVLLTRSGLEKWASNERTIKVSRTIDSILYKEENLRDQPDFTHAQLLSLIHGYKVLRESDHTTTELLGLLQTDAVGRDAAREAVPPDDDWTAMEAAHWIRFVLLGFPGVVYNCNYAATALGLSIDSFNQPQLLELLEEAKYRGPFGQEQEYWWRHTLLDIASRLGTATSETLGLREGFRLAASEKLGMELEPSTDIETGIGLADTICYLENVPTCIETSLPYRPDARPPVMDEARISFRAIRESNEIDENYLDATNRMMLEEIRRRQ